MFSSFTLWCVLGVTASIVGHSAARSENGITYSLYSAGISDQQKRDLVDRVTAP